MKTVVLLIFTSLSLTSFAPKQAGSNDWVFCTAVGRGAYASSLVTYNIDDYKDLLNAWKLRLREELGDGYNENYFSFAIVDRECSVGNVRYDSKYAASQGRDCYIRKMRDKGVTVKTLQLDY